jgi:hypothetical protein
VSEPTTRTAAPTREQDERGRFYYWTDEQGVEHEFWSVTTALNTREKDGLKFWAAGLAARRAMDNLPMLIAAQRIDPCGRAYARSEPYGCDRCPECLHKWLAHYHLGESSRRAREGSALHDAVEQWILTGEIPGIDKLVELRRLAEPDTDEKYLDEMARALPPYLKTLRQWLEDYELRPEDFIAAEMTVYNTVHRYGGTLDWILRLPGRRNRRCAVMVARILGRWAEYADVVGDTKSREGEGKEFYPEYSLQLAPYRHANFCRVSKVDTRLAPMPPTHGAVLLQVRPDGYTFEPVDSGVDTFRTFLNYLSAFQWEVTDGPKTILVKSFSIPDGFAWPPPEQPTTSPEMPGGPAEPVKRAPAKRAPRKTAARKAAPVEAATPDTTGVAGSARMRTADLGAIGRTGFGSPGARLTDEDIPF